MRRKLQSKLYMAVSKLMFSLKIHQFGIKQTAQLPKKRLQQQVASPNPFLMNVFQKQQRL